MERNVLPWSKALEMGHEPRNYPYSFDDVPTGEFEAVLDFKIWAKKVMGINCYFTQSETGKKFRLTVYCHGYYRVWKEEMDFATCPVNRKYRIKVIANQKKNMVLASAVLLE